ncbi:hypothetical protein M9H77_13116 [Catharanthus roseus]|uniref:Uncharacterized protein n=1 Tax=Catharanthus roseus TaxID=4058 RepID=A0ACC0BJM7_CATRO|nr:hypothetical protein M9H77_13116 [Catharanthus roseus]
MNNDNEMYYLWTIRPDISKEGIHVLVEFKPIQSQIFSNVQHTHISIQEDHSNVCQHVMEDDNADIDYDVSSASNEDNGDNDEEDNISTPLNPLSSTAVNQWQNSQWFNKLPYDYMLSGAFLDMGSGKQIDDLIEPGTIKLLDWNDVMTDLQLGMRFVDKIQAISAVQKLSIRIGREFRVVKSKSNQWTAKCYHHSDSNFCLCYIRIKKKETHG